MSLQVGSRIATSSTLSISESRLFEWAPREKDVAPKVCLKCKSPYWDRLKKKA